MKVSELIAQLQEFNDMDEDIYCEYWTGRDILEYLQDFKDDIPENTTKCVQYIIRELEKYGTGFENNPWSAINEYFDSWLKKQYKETSNDTQSA